MKQNYHYLTRILAADPRPPVSQQLGDEEGDAPPSKKQTYLDPLLSNEDFTGVDVTRPSNKQGKQEEEQEEQPDDTSKKDEPAEEEVPKGAIKTGKSFKDQKGRLGKIKAFHPYLFIVSGAGRVGTLQAFFQEAHKAGILNDPEYIERIAGRAHLTGKESDAASLTFAYLVSDKKVNELASKAEGLLTHKENFESKIAASNPFMSVKIPDVMSEALGGEVRNLRNTMQSTLDALRKSSGEGDDSEEGGAVAALQMQSTIPVDYMRFLSKSNKEWEFYIGGQPSAAGRQGIIYVLCKQEEANLFRKVIKEFGPPNNFFDELNHISNIDSAFKSEEPHKSGTLDNCLILSFADKFDLKQLPSLHNIGSDIAKKKLKPYEYVDGTIVKGDMVVHFSKDMRRCIMWLGAAPITLQKTEEDALKELGVVDIDTTFTK